MKAGSVIACGVFVFILRTGCDEKDQLPVEQNPMEQDIELVEQLNAKNALALANEWRVSNSGVISDLRADAVTFVFPEGYEVSVPLPADTMVVAVAPYITDTHPCAIHKISDCRSELVDVEIRVLAEAQDGTVLMDETLRTAANGFIELWLPRNIEINLTLEAQDKRTTGKITTYDNSNTCVTTFKLQ